MKKVIIFSLALIFFLGQGAFARKKSGKEERKSDIEFMTSESERLEMPGAAILMFRIVPEQNESMQLPKSWHTAVVTPATIRKDGWGSIRVFDPGAEIPVLLQGYQPIVITLDGAIPYSESGFARSGQTLPSAPAALKSLQEREGARIDIGEVNIPLLHPAKTKQLRGKVRIKKDGNLLKPEGISVEMFPEYPPMNNTADSKPLSPIKYGLMPSRIILDETGEFVGVGLIPSLYRLRIRAKDCQEKELLVNLSGESKNLEEILLVLESSD